ncbi:MAG: hypothetical protein WCC63_03610 [Candidatus Bathyarchaeia archaeon]
MSSRTLVESVPSQQRLSFNIENVDTLFPGFVSGDFAVLHGSSAVLHLSMLLCVRAQLPYQLGGLETNVLFIDGGNNFRLYEVSRIAQLHELDPRGVLERIFISRAFTAYQMTSLVLDELTGAVERYSSKLVILSDIAGLYLDKDVPKKEAKDVFNQLTAYLSRFAEENRVIIVATYPPHYPSDRNLFFKMMSCGRANVAISVRPNRHGQQLCLEKHQSSALGRIAISSESLPLTKFMEA